MKTVELLWPAAGLRALISGAAASIGAVISQAFLNVDTDVYICDVNPVAVDRAKTERCHAFSNAGMAPVPRRATRGCRT